MTTTPDRPWVLFAAGLRNLADQLAKSFDARTVDNGSGTVYDVDPTGPAERLPVSDVDGDLRDKLKMAIAKPCGYDTWEAVTAVDDGEERWILGCADAALSVVQPLLTSDEIQLRSLTESQDAIRAAAGLPEDIEVGDLIVGVRSLRAELTEARRLADGYLGQSRAAHDTITDLKRRLADEHRIANQYREQSQRARSELAALREQAVILPRGPWKSYIVDAIQGLGMKVDLSNRDKAMKVEDVVSRLIESWRDERPSRPLSGAADGVGSGSTPSSAPEPTGAKCAETIGAPDLSGIRKIHRCVGLDGHKGLHVWGFGEDTPTAPEPSPVDRKYGLGQHAPISNPEPEKALQPRVFPLDSPQPDHTVTQVRGDTNGVIFRRMTPAGGAGGPWFATKDSGGDGSLYSWGAINSTRSAYGGMAVTEVVAPSTPDTPQSEKDGA